jgi:hypothetical protein
MSVITKTISDQWSAVRVPTLPLASRPGLRNLLLVMLIVLSAISVLIIRANYLFNTKICSILTRQAVKLLASFCLSKVHWLVKRELKISLKIA